MIWSLQGSFSVLEARRKKESSDVSRSIRKYFQLIKKGLRLVSIRRCRYLSLTLHIVLQLTGCSILDKISLYRQARIRLSQTATTLTWVNPSSRRRSVLIIALDSERQMTLARRSVARCRKMLKRHKMINRRKTLWSWLHFHSCTKRHLGLIITWTYSATQVRNQSSLEKQGWLNLRTSRQLQVARLQLVRNKASKSKIRCRCEIMETQKLVCKWSRKSLRQLPTHMLPAWKFIRDGLTQTTRNS
jgi:hypothetical protein